MSARYRSPYRRGAWQSSVPVNGRGGGNEDSSTSVSSSKASRSIDSASSTSHSHAVVRAQPTATTLTARYISSSATHSHAMARAQPTATTSTARYISSSDTHSHAMAPAQSTATTSTALTFSLSSSSTSTFATCASSPSTASLAPSPSTAQAEFYAARDAARGHGLFSGGVLERDVLSKLGIHEGGEENGRETPTSVSSRSGWVGGSEKGKGRSRGYSRARSPMPDTLATSPPLMTNPMPLTLATSPPLPPLLTTHAGSPAKTQEYDPYRPPISPQRDGTSSHANHNDDTNDIPSSASTVLPNQQGMIPTASTNVTALGNKLSDISSPTQYYMRAFESNPMDGRAHSSTSHEGQAGRAYSQYDYDFSASEDEGNNLVNSYVYSQDGTHSERDASSAHHEDGNTLSSNELTMHSISSGADMDMHPYKAFRYDDTAEIDPPLRRVPSEQDLVQRTLAAQDRVLVSGEKRQPREQADAAVEVEVEVMTASPDVSSVGSPALSYLRLSSDTTPTVPNSFLAALNGASANVRQSAVSANSANSAYGGIQPASPPATTQTTNFPPLSPTALPRSTRTSSWSQPRTPPPSMSLPAIPTSSSLNKLDTVAEGPLQSPVRPKPKSHRSSGLSILSAGSSYRGPSLSYASENIPPSPTSPSTTPGTAQHDKLSDLLQEAPQRSCLIFGNDESMETDVQDMEAFLLNQVGGLDIQDLVAMQHQLATVREQGVVSEAKSDTVETSVTLDDAPSARLDNADEAFAPKIDMRASGDDSQATAPDVSGKSIDLSGEEAAGTVLAITAPVDAPTKPDKLLYNTSPLTSPERQLSQKISSTSHPSTPVQPSNGHAEVDASLSITQPGDISTDSSFLSQPYTPPSTLRGMPRRAPNSTPSVLLRSVQLQAQEATTALKGRSPQNDAFVSQMPSEPSHGFLRKRSPSLARSKSVKNLKISDPKLVSTSANLQTTKELPHPASISRVALTPVSRAVTSPSASEQSFAGHDGKASPAGFSFKKRIARAASANKLSRQDERPDSPASSVSHLRSDSASHSRGSSGDTRPSDVHTGIRSLMSKLTRRKPSLRHTVMIPEPFVISPRAATFSNSIANGQTPRDEQNGDLQPPSTPFSTHRNGKGGSYTGSEAGSQLADVSPLKYNAKTSPVRDVGSQSAANESQEGNPRASAASLESMRRLYEAASALGLDSDKVNDLIDAAGYSRKSASLQAVLQASTHEPLTPVSSMVSPARSPESSRPSGDLSLASHGEAEVDFSNTSLASPLRRTPSSRRKMPPIMSGLQSSSQASPSAPSEYHARNQSNVSLSAPGTSTNTSEHRRSIRDRPATPPPTRSSVHRRRKSEAQEAEGILPISASSSNNAINTPSAIRRMSTVNAVVNDVRSDVQPVPVARTGLAAPNNPHARTSAMSSRTLGSYDARSIYGMYEYDDDELPPMSHLNVIVASGHIPAPSFAAKRASINLAPGIDLCNFTKGASNRHSRVELTEFANGDIAFNIVQSLRNNGQLSASPSGRDTFFPIEQLHRRIESGSSYGEQDIDDHAEEEPSPNPAEADPLRLLVRRHQRTHPSGAGREYQPKRRTNVGMPSSHSQQSIVRLALGTITSKVCRIAAELTRRFAG